MSVGSIDLDPNAKPMSITFLFRLVCNLVKERIRSREEALTEGKPCPPFPEVRKGRRRPPSRTRRSRLPPRATPLAAHACGRLSPRRAQFVSFQMIAFYGVKSLATRYLQEMYAGLLSKRQHHPRIGLFARAMQCFPNEALCVQAFAGTSEPLSHGTSRIPHSARAERRVAERRVAERRGAVRYLGALLALLESERGATRTTYATATKPEISAR